jgi:hypothetical protein
MRLFPLNTGVSEIRGIVEIIKDNGRMIEMSKLAEETNDDIDDLFPLIDTCVMLRLCTISKGVVKLTKSGSELASHNTKELFSKALRKVEPFKSAMAMVGREGLTTKELASKLGKKGVSFHPDDITNRELLKNLLVKWGVTNNLFHYDGSIDLWSKYTANR